MPHGRNIPKSNRIKIVEIEVKSISPSHIYMTANFPGFRQALDENWLGCMGSNLILYQEYKGKKSIIIVFCPIVEVNAV